MTKLDARWSIEQIDAFLFTTDRVARKSTPDVVRLGTAQRGSQVDASGQAHVVELILDRVLPVWRHSARPDPDPEWKWLRNWAARAKAQLEREDELREHLGDGAPEMDAGRLHPWVWEAAASLFRTGHFAQAVHQASVRINAETQAKVSRRDVSETNLFNQVFSLEVPKPGAPRLRLMNDDGSPTFQSLHRGARAFAEGLYAAIRNPVSHDPQDELEEHIALERLAAFSVLARWVDASQVVTATD